MTCVEAIRDCLGGKIRTVTRRELTTGFDMGARVAHSTSVVTLARRASTLALALALVVGNAALCAGWAPTPEARMACCADRNCSMHKSESSDSDSQHELSQAQADSCCALSESHHSSGSSAPTQVVIVSAAVLGPATMLAERTPELTIREAWRYSASRHADPVPKYVLLSVFLV
jgi:hypothetical protein